MRMGIRPCVTRHEECALSARALSRALTLSMCATTERKTLGHTCEASPVGFAACSNPRLSAPLTCAISLLAQQLRAVVPSAASASREHCCFPLAS